MEKKMKTSIMGIVGFGDLEGMEKNISSIIIGSWMVNRQTCKITISCS